MKNHALLTDLTPEQEEKVSGGVVIMGTAIFLAKKFGVGAVIKKFGAGAWKTVKSKQFQKALAKSRLKKDIK